MRFAFGPQLSWSRLRPTAPEVPVPVGLARSRGGVKPSGAWGDGTNCVADDDSAGFAHEVLEFSGQWYLSGVVGRDGQFKLKFTPIEWTMPNSLTLAK